MTLKNIVHNIKQLLKYFFRALGYKVSRIPDYSAKDNYCNIHEIESEEINGLGREIRKILNLLNYTKTNKVAYNGGNFESGYHTIELGEKTFAGQRNPAERLAGVPFDFNGSTVLDIGSNQGGMLFAIADQIKFGVGIDYDPLMVNVANRIKSYEGLDNIEFFVFDLERENHSLIDNFLPAAKVDIVFLLAVCRWVENWEEVIAKARDISNNLLFEANGTDEQQHEQENRLRDLYSEITKLRDASIDDPQNKSRQLFMCRA